ncbi:hypothetical protein GH714_010969 [Hevea brasiliensis]|uniref:Uncharacterized protein n=1 Tax=Hevea brasiliensis TaxID=3981 RepID=A0A6A6M7U1_HEVBR|nr:hypothetical protein GH714_010969 [Hevea brasiliensis]
MGVGHSQVVNEIKELGYAGVNHIAYHSPKKLKFECLKLVITEDEVRKMFAESVEHGFMKIYMETISVNEPKHVADATEASNVHEMNEEPIVDVNVHYRPTERSLTDTVSELGEDQNESKNDLSVDDLDSDEIHSS